MKDYLPFIALIAIILSIVSFGFQINIPNFVYALIGVPVFTIAIVGLYIHDFFSENKKKITVLIVDFFCLLLYVFVLILCVVIFTGYENMYVLKENFNGLVILASFVFFVRELSEVKISLRKKTINPAQLFVVSFLTLIFVGTFLLLLPNATNEKITIIDALFTSTSAVCVTGLIVVDTGTHFTVFGQSVILILIQMGGLGIMTFASYFSYFFRGGATYKNQLLLKDMTNAQKIGEVFKTFKKIIFITFLIEGLGAVLIYFSINKYETFTFSEQVFFSIFHTVSGFCNAGFSTLPDSLYTEAFRFNYPLHLIIAFLFIIGGLGFPIVFNLVTYIKYLITNRFLNLVAISKTKYTPWVLNINSRIVLITSFLLTVLGTLFFYIIEYNNTLSEHSGIGKIITAFFGAVTTRTAGFNSVDTSALGFSTIMIVFLLMWIGASPGSTGGGIKTSTFAIATLNFLSLAKGKERIEVFRREISETSVRRAFAIISLSFMVIGMSIFLIATFDPEKDLLTIAFESFSAYSTVGLSLGITGSLSTPSKVVIIFVMFIGRVSMLTILIAVMKKVAFKEYRYPNEDILIN